MPIKLIDNTVSERDGTSQPGRAAAALLPEYVSVDERSAEDILRFVRDYAETLVYYGLDNEPAGDFRAFVGALSPIDIARFLKEPGAFDPDRTPALFRPHFTLFLAFLRLLEDVRSELNRLTRRHLDFFYREFLRLRVRKALPDRVNVLLQLAARERRVFVPAGTAATAGVDAIGKDRVYRTSRDIVVNRARIEKVSSLYVDRDVVGIRKSWHDHRNDPEAGRYQMLSIAYGRPLAGDALPDYPGNPPTTLADDDQVDALLLALKNLVKFSSTGLFLSLVNLRAFVRLPDTTDDSDDVIANKRVKYKSTIDDIGRKRQSTYVPPANASLYFAAYAQAALGALSVPGRPDITTIDGYWAALLEIEKYFAMSIDNFEILIDTILVGSSDWDSGYETQSEFITQLLENAYREKLFSERMADLRMVRESKGSISDAYIAMLQRALGDEVTGFGQIDAYVNRLSAFLSETDLSKLASAFDVERWVDVERLLAHAIFSRCDDFVPRKVTWFNVYPAAVGQRVLSNRSNAKSGATQPFLPFGAPLDQDVHAPPAPVLGFALTSPILALSGGLRTITLTFGLRASGYEFERLKKIVAETYGKLDIEGRSLFPLVFELSTANGWVRCPASLTSSPVFGTYDALVGPQPTASNWIEHEHAGGLRIVLTWPENEVPIVPLSEKIDGMDPRWPALRILMLPVWSAEQSRYVTYYREFSSLFVGAVHIRVDVAGLVPSTLESDDMALDPKRTFDPFGSAPASGSRFLIGHPEVVSKRIDRLTFRFQWMGAPASFADQYANYGIAPPGSAPNFVVRVSSVDRAGTRVLAAAAPIFGADTSAATEIKFSQLDPPLNADVSALVGTGPGTRLVTWKRRFEWELGPIDFQHRTYPAVAAQKSLEFATDAVKKAVSAYQVKPPYTPKLKNICVDYSSSVEIVLYRPGPADRLDRTYHVHPFGVVELDADQAFEEMPLFPRYERESAFFIGFSGVVPPESVTMLVQLDEGTADRHTAPPEVQWSQLLGNRWEPLGHNVVVDGTSGLQKSGVIEFSLTAGPPSTMLASNLTWVRGTIAGDHAGICDVYELHTQAVEAYFDDQGNDPQHYRTPIPSGAITRLKTPIAGIVGLEQPYASYGGRMAEDATRFATRASERLRHKQRALSSWDYERIVLEAFPQIFKAKCIPSSEDAPGVVQVLVIPDVRAVPTNEFAPRVPVALLGTIQRYLALRAPRSATVVVRNAAYRGVCVRIGVRFSEKTNQAYWMGRLGEELNRFLSPWAYDDGADIAVGGRIYASSIVEFVDRRPYVDYVAGISLFYTDDEGERIVYVFPPGEEGGAYCVEAGGADRVLVAFPRHRIDLLTTAHYDARLYRGVGFMELEMDFVVG